jgi:phosphoglycerate dehydrogenase-like enzyme
MNIWSNTSTLKGLIDDLPTDASPAEAEVALIGGKVVKLDEFPNLRGIFKCGVGRDNVPEAEAEARGIQCGYPSHATAGIIFEETASFACHLVLKCLYADIGDFASWSKQDRTALSARTVLVLGTGNIGGRVASKLERFVRVATFDVRANRPEDLEEMIRRADCITLHVPLNESTTGFFNAEKLSWMKDGASLVNTARAAIVPEEDLYQKLKSGRLRAAFDVFWKEPYEGKLLELPQDRFMVTPHVASTCEEFLGGLARDFRAFLAMLSNNE